jgi:hypothetical protein
VRPASRSAVVRESRPTALLASLPGLPTATHKVRVGPPEVQFAVDAWWPAYLDGDAEKSHATRTGDGLISERLSAEEDEGRSWGIALLTETEPGRRNRRTIDSFTYAKGENDVPHVANQGDGRHPGDEQNGTATVVAGCPEAEHELDDARHQLEPPDLNLAPRRDRHDDASKVPATIRKKLKTAARAAKVLPDERRRRSGRDEDNCRQRVQELPPAPGHEQHTDPRTPAAIGARELFLDFAQSRAVPIQVLLGSGSRHRVEERSCSRSRSADGYRMAVDLCMT